MAPRGMVLCVLPPFAIHERYTSAGSSINVVYDCGDAQQSHHGSG